MPLQYIYLSFLQQVWPFLEAFCIEKSKRTYLQRERFVYLRLRLPETIETKRPVAVNPLLYSAYSFIPKDRIFSAGGY